MWNPYASLGLTLSDIGGQSQVFLHLEWQEICTMYAIHIYAGNILIWLMHKHVSEFVSGRICVLSLFLLPQLCQSWNNMFL